MALSGVYRATIAVAACIVHTGSAFAPSCSTPSFVSHVSRSWVWPKNHNPDASSSNRNPLFDARTARQGAVSLSMAGGDDRSSDTIMEGSLVEYNSENKQILSVVLSPDGKKNWKVQTSSGHVASLKPNDIKYQIMGSEYTPKDISLFEERARVALQQDTVTGGENVRAVWEMVMEEDAITYDLETLSDLLMGESTPLAQYGARAVLNNGLESMCFKEIKPVTKKGVVITERDLYEARPVEIVEKLRKEAESEREVEVYWEGLRERITNGLVLEEESEEVQSSFAALERLGCQEEVENTANSYNSGPVAPLEDERILQTARDFLKQLNRKATSESARQVLISTGIWNIHENLELKRFNIPLTFSPELLSDAEHLIANPIADVDVETRRDLSHLNSYAIDDASTKEIDDALSVEGPLEDGTYRLWVHIADPSRHIALHSPLDVEARKRTSSLYLPTGVVPMFPLSIAAGPLSLQEGKIACALSIGVILHADGGLDLEQTPPIITPSYVNTTRLTYDQVDELLDPNADIQTFSEDITAQTISELRYLDYASNQRLQWRKDGGSLDGISDYNLPDMDINAQPSTDAASPDGWDISITARTRHTASRIVTEHMLLANEALALFGQQHAIPMPYRSQSVRDVSQEDIDAVPPGPARSWFAIRTTFASTVSGNVLPHEGLGLDAYVQATSPVRRYGDLALHHQVKAFLRGEDLPFPKEEEEETEEPAVAVVGTVKKNKESEIIRMSQEGGKFVNRLGRNAEDYWLKEYLKRYHSQNAENPVSAIVLSADVRDRDEYKYQSKILLPDLGAIQMVKSKSRQLEIGAEIPLSVNSFGEFLL